MAKEKVMQPSCIMIKFETAPQGDPGDLEHLQRQEQRGILLCRFIDHEDVQRGYPIKLVLSGPPPPPLRGGAH